jgi:hypothetical protein
VSSGRIVAAVVGALAFLVGCALTLAGGTVVWAHATQRDADGYYTTSVERFDTPTYAFTSDVDFGARPGDRRFTVDHPLGTIRVRARPAAGGALFLGVARTRAVDRWLTGVAHEHVTQVSFGLADRETRRFAGSRAPAPPLGQDFWTEAVSGRGRQTLIWPSESGRWTLVLMNLDGSKGVSADVSVGAKIPVLLPIGLGLTGFGLVVVAGGVIAILLAARQRRPQEETAATALGGPAAAPYPARLEGHLDPGLSRWLWLVKWLLVIPHVIVLALLWAVVTVLTVVAGFAILFTGRYPRGIFDFNVGVMRWTWRVSFYAVHAFGTDRYPPFGFASDPEYPADFTVEYPERLSRGLVLVKWWLLAIPHYVVVCILVGGFGAGWSGAWRIAGGLGLIAVLALIAGISLLFSGSYPEPIFDVVMGLNRWCFRVLAYVALMRDEYPPFRVDSGPSEPQRASVGSIGPGDGPGGP